MRTIYKYEMPGGMVVSGKGGVGVEMHGPAVIRHFGLDPDGKLCVWAEVNKHDKTRVHRLFIIGTGHEVPENARYVMTCNDRAYMWHLYKAP